MVAAMARALGTHGSYYRFIPNLTRQDGSAFDQAAAQFGL
jgi:hypothetical protein